MTEVPKLYERVPCQACEGTGRHISVDRMSHAKAKCPICRGDGYRYREVTVTLEAVVGGFDPVTLPVTFVDAVPLACPGFGVCKGPPVCGPLGRCYWGPEGLPVRDGVAG